MRLAIAALLVSSMASAEPLPTIESTHPPTIRLAGPIVDVTIERGEITWLVVGAEPPTRWIHTSFSDGPTTISIDLPAGTRVVGMSFDHGDGPIWAKQQEPLAADHEIRTGTAPALAEWSGSSSDEEHVTLRITELGHTAFALELPEIPSVRVVAPVAISLDGKHQPKITAFTPVHVDANGPQLDSAMSLLVDPTVPSIDLGVVTVRDFVNNGTLDKEIIRRYIRRHVPALTQCFLRVAQRTRTGDGAMLHFTIDDNGDTHDVTADVTDKEVGACLDQEVAGWDFPAVAPNGLRTQVNYPLTFELR